MARGLNFIVMFLVQLIMRNMSKEIQIMYDKQVFVIFVEMKLEKALFSLMEQLSQRLKLVTEVRQSKLPKNVKMVKMINRMMVVTNVGLKPVVMN